MISQFSIHKKRLCVSRDSHKIQRRLACIYTNKTAIWMYSKASCPKNVEWDLRGTPRIWIQELKLIFRLTFTSSFPRRRVVRRFHWQRGQSIFQNQSEYASEEINITSASNRTPFMQLTGSPSFVLSCRLHLNCAGCNVVATARSDSVMSPVMYLFFWRSAVRFAN